MHVLGRLAAGEGRTSAMAHHAWPVVRWGAIQVCANLEWVDYHPCLTVHNLTEILGRQAAPPIPSTQNLPVSNPEELDPIYHGLMHIDEDVKLEGMWGPSIDRDKGEAGNEGTRGRLS